MEAAILVMKQKIDSFALRRGIGRLETDCTSLLGLSFLKPEEEQTENAPDADGVGGFVCQLSVSVYTRVRAKCV